ncbi:unnamed protein product, partial [Polarella glacialis]
MANPRSTFFRAFSDRSASDLEAFEWNSTMDLLACLTAPPDSTMSIYRLLSEDQSPKLLSEKITGIGTSLAWAPCGRRIAVGDRLGGVTIYDGETGAVLHSRRPHSKPVTALSWADAAGHTPGSSEVPWSHMLPPLLAVPSAPSNMFAESPSEADGDSGGGSRGGGGFNLLVSADEGGRVVVSAGGTFPLQALELFGGGSGGGSLGLGPGPTTSPAVGGDLLASDERSVASTDLLRQLRHLGSQSRKPMSVRLSPDLRCLAVLLGPAGSLPPAPSASSSSPRPKVSTSAGATPPPQERWASPGPWAEQPGTPCTAARHAGAIAGSELAAVVLDVRKLAVRRLELEQCSRMVERLMSVANYSRQAVGTLGTVWRSAADGFVKKVRGLTDSIQAYSGAAGGINLASSGDGNQGKSGDVHAELLLTLCTGNPSDAVHAFLTRQTSPQQLQRLEKGLMQALEYVNLVVCTRLQVAAQHLLAIIHELEACAESGSRRFRAIGLEKGSSSGTVLRRLASRTRRFAKLTELLLLDSARARRFARTLFQLLLRQAQKLSEQTPAEGTPSSRLAGADSGAGSAAPSQADLDDFVAAARRRQSLELADVTERIGAPAPAAEARRERASESRPLGHKENGNAEDKCVFITHLLIVAAVHSLCLTDVGE